MLGKYSITHLLIYKSILVERIRERGKNIKKQIQIKFFTSLKAYTCPDINL